MGGCVYCPPLPPHCSVVLFLLWGKNPSVTGAWETAHTCLVGFPGLFGGSHVCEAVRCQAHTGPRGEGRRGESILLREPQMGGPHSCLSWGPATLTQGAACSLPSLSVVDSSRATLTTSQRCLRVAPGPQGDHSLTSLTGQRSHRDSGHRRECHHPDHHPHCHLRAHGQKVRLPSSRRPPHLPPSLPPPAPLTSPPPGHRPPLLFCRASALLPSLPFTGARGFW